MNKLIELRRAKMLALSLLLIAAATFVVTLFLPPNFWVSGVKAIAEAENKLIHISTINRSKY